MKKSSHQIQIHRDLLAWYAANKRTLPWRKNTDPYRVHVSEIMLQQTRVEAVIPYFERFLSVFPNLVTLARAPTDQVMKYWAGLGYYSRARNLQKSAQEILDQFSGKYPAEKSQLIELSGIGDYTAAAIASIAFAQAEIAIDGNLERVFSRLLNLFKNPKKEGREEIRDFGNQLSELGSAGDLNQALMDLSSALCRPKNPLCEECPLQKYCASRKAGTQSELPLRQEKQKTILLKAHGLVVIHKDHLLIEKREKGKWLAGLWDIPWWTEQEEVPQTFRAMLKTARKVHQGSRGITKYKITFTVSHKELAKRNASLTKNSDRYRWVELSQLSEWNLPRPTEKALENFLAQQKNT